MEEQIMKVLPGCQLCRGMTAEQIRELLAAGGSRIRTYEKGEVIFFEGEQTRKLCVLLQGKVAISKTTCFGKRILLSEIREPGDMFGEVYLFMEKEKYEVEAEAQEKTSCLELSEGLFKLEGDLKIELEERLIRNLLGIFAGKAYHLSNKVRLLGSGSIREKLAVFLSERETENGEVQLEMNREELADFLNVARPSLSRELMNMTEEGILRVEGKKVHVTDQEKLESYL